MTYIDWTSFTWEAFATLTTGALAVGGAVWIGIRQGKIAWTQTEILAREARLDELTLRHELFDRRMQVYLAVSNFLNSIFIHARPPEPEVDMAFHKAVAAARFLFDERVNRELEEIRIKSLEYGHLTAQMRAIIQGTRKWEADEPERESEFLKWFIDRLGTLQDLFGDEIRLT